MTVALRPSRTHDHRSSWSKGRRAGAALGAVSIGLLALAGCSQPTPLATVTVGSGSVTAEASCYKDGKSLGALSSSDKGGQAKFQTCVSAKPAKTITVHPGEKVRIGLEPDAAKNGWLALANNARINNLTKQTYADFDGEQLFYNQQSQSMADSTTLSIITSSGSNFTGVWNVKLKRVDS